MALRMDLSSIALQGLDRASAQLDAAAGRIVDAGLTSACPPADTISLSEEIVALMSAETLYSANISTLKSADQTQRSLLNVLT